MSEVERVAQQLNLGRGPVAAAIALLDDGNTIPFIARYRKEATDSLDETQVRAIAETLAGLRALDERRQTILTTIESQGALTPALRDRLLAATTRTELEDLYQPYKPRRRTRAGVARERGLGPLAELILRQPRADGRSLDQLAQPFVGDEVPDVDAAWAGARDIVAEIVSDHPDVRGGLRDKAQRFARLRSEKVDGAGDPRAVYALYYAFENRVDRLRPYQILAINRGEKEKVLRVRIEIDERDWRGAIGNHFRPHPRSPLGEQLQLAIEDGAQRLLLPAIVRDVRQGLRTRAEAHAIRTFATNLRGLLSQPPLAGRAILGIDPAYRTGCKVAVIDATGKMLATTTIYPHEPRRQWTAARQTLADLAGRFGVSLIAIGNGTASRETEQLVAELIREAEGDVRLQYVITNEAGASVYSASPLAGAELPDLDVSLRGAVSIARRVQDPLAELIKVDPKSIGVGLYQHDVDQKALDEALTAVVESVVNQVGVNANTASPALLTHVAGIGPRLAERIVAHREENGRFPHRQALLAVAGLGPKSFEQAAGFLRIPDGQEPLDGSAIHPESYDIARAVLDQAGVSLAAPRAAREAALEQLRIRRPLPQLAAQLGAGIPTLADIFEQLVRPGRDPREDAPPPLLRQDILTMEDLQPGLRLNGTVRNVVEFGAFVDIGVKQDGLLHRSQYGPDGPPGVGDVIEVGILNVEPERGRISLTLLADAA